jgi:amino acid adenylation domain-containing protein
MLGGLLPAAAASNPHGVALVEPSSGRHICYSELESAANQLADQFQSWGIGPGHRVGIWLPKSIESVATIHASLRTGAAHVPVDPLAPAARAATIFSLAGVSAAVVHESFVEPLKNAWPPELADHFPYLVIVNDHGTENTDCIDFSQKEKHWRQVQANTIAQTIIPPDQPLTDLAYILFTSGSTGQPKGVMLTHENAWCFLDWCEREIAPTDADVFASHAPLHFDLSVFDLYMSVLHAAPLVLIDEQMAKDPVRLAGYLKSSPITVWYSAPSILAMMVEHGDLEKPEPGQTSPWPGPKITLFAGEVFPVGPLKALRKCWPSSTFWNLYGPTETNVCTAYRAPAKLESLEAPLPIGPVCSPLEARVVDPEGLDVAHGEKGELVIAGPRVMPGYFGRDDLTAAAFFVTPDHRKWYRTGDLVIDDGSGNFIFHGRRDRMVKKRGYRIELGEIESALYRNDAIERAAVVAVPSESQGLRIAAFVAMKPDRPASIIAIKRHCSTQLPQYMIPDDIKFLPALPTTSTDKVDYPALKKILGLVA